MKPTMQRMMILKVDETFDFDNPPEQVLIAMQDAKIQFPESEMLGTRDYNGDKLILIMTRLSRGEVTSWFNGAYPTVDGNGDLINIDLGLTWQVMADELTPVPQVPLLNFFVDTPVFDIDGNQTGTTPVTDLEGILQVYAGHKWIFN